MIGIRCGGTETCLMPLSDVDGSTWSFRFTQTVPLQAHVRWAGGEAITGGPLRHPAGRRWRVTSEGLEGVRIGWAGPSEEWRLRCESEQADVSPSRRAGAN